MFDHPTLVTLTAPTCGGKSFLLEQMVRSGFDRLVSTTDRAQRTGEVDGVHYYFIDTAVSQLMEKHGEFAELVTYNGTRYGVTNDEIICKMNSVAPPIVIVEPSAIDIYQEYCRARDWHVFSVYVETPEALRLERLAYRTADDTIRALVKLMSTLSDDITDEEADNLGREAIATQIKINNHRLKAVIEQERGWLATHKWDAIVSGQDATKALADIQFGIKNRNQRLDIYE